MQRGRALRVSLPVLVGGQDRADVVVWHGTTMVARIMWFAPAAPCCGLPCDAGGAGWQRLDGLPHSPLYPPPISFFSISIPQVRGAGWMAGCFQHCGVCEPIGCRLWWLSIFGEVADRSGGRGCVVFRRVGIRKRRSLVWSGLAGCLPGEWVLQGVRLFSNFSAEST